MFFFLIPKYHVHMPAYRYLLIWLITDIKVFFLWSIKYQIRPLECYFLLLLLILARLPLTTLALVCFFLDAEVDWLTGKSSGLPDPWLAFLAWAIRKNKIDTGQSCDENERARDTSTYSSASSSSLEQLEAKEVVPFCGSDCLGQG